jgi:hypothetical protein
MKFKTLKKKIINIKMINKENINNIIKKKFQKILFLKVYSKINREKIML